MVILMTLNLFYYILGSFQIYAFKTNGPIIMDLIVIASKTFSTYPSTISVWLSQGKESEIPIKVQ